MIRHLTLMILKRDGKLLLGVKKRGFGMGKINCAGGKVESGETVREAAIRETFEEVGIRVNSCEKVGQVVFRELYFKGRPETDVMHIFMSEDFDWRANRNRRNCAGMVLRLMRCHTTRCGATTNTGCQKFSRQQS